jgi:hypothetical protein
MQLTCPSHDYEYTEQQRTLKAELSRMNTSK